jgi:branched-chain amino acid transport system permease protein
VCALIVLVLLANLLRSRVGRNWRALRDNDTAAALAGLNVAKLRVRAFIVSAACAGVAGSLLAVTMLNVTPGAFTLALSIQLLTAVVLGGLGSLAGAVWGGIILVLVPPFLTNFAASHGVSAGSASVPIVGYGLVLIVVMLVFPAGIQGGVRRLLGLARPTQAEQVSAIGRRWQLVRKSAGASSAVGHAADNVVSGSAIGNQIAASEAAAEDGLTEEGTR